jgi:hypothetical protein
MAAPIEALETLMAWLERDDDEASVMFFDELQAFFCRSTDLPPELMRQRLAELLRHMAHALDQVI